MNLHLHAVRQLLWMWYSAASLFRFLLARSKLRKQHPHQGAEKRDAQLDLPHIREHIPPYCSAKRTPETGCSFFAEKYGDLQVKAYRKLRSQHLGTMQASKMHDFRENLIYLI